MIPSFSVKRPFTVAVTVILTLILGSVSFTKMTTDLFPSMELPFVIVNTSYPGASPEKVEVSVTKPLEKSLATTSGLKNIDSVSSENSSMIMLEFNQDVNMDSVMLDIDSKINMVEGYFDDKVSSPIIIKMNPDMMPIMVLSVDIEGMDVKEVTKYMKDEVIPMFERIDGVASIEANGLVENQLKITLNEEKIKSLNNKVLNNVESEFKEQENSLSSSKNEINSSKSDLENNLNSQINEIDNAIKNLQSGIKNVENLVNSSGITKEEALKAIDDANIERTKISFQIDNLKLSLQETTNEEEIKIINEKIQVLEETKLKIEDGISKSNELIKAIDSLSEMKTKEQELNKTKLSLKSQLDSAKKELEKGESEVNKGIESLEESKEGAISSADISKTITPEMIGNILMAQNFSMPAGYIKEGEKEYSVKVGEEFTTKEEIENLLLFDIKGVGEVRLKDVAEVSFSDNSGETYTNINGNDGVVLTFQKSSGFATTDVTKSINKEIKNLESTNNKVNVTTLMDQGIYIKFIVDNVISNLLYGGVLAVIILLIFLKSFKTTIVVAFSIPISVLFTVIMMYFSGITLNIISLSGLALGVGMLVDNSIVVIENIYRLKSEGYSTREAAVYGTRQVSGAIFASTLTTICVFLPIVFTEGMTKDMFLDMALTIAYSLIASLVVALTVVPAMSSNLLNNVKEKTDSLFERFVDFYEVILTKSLQIKFIVLLVVGGLFGFSIYKSLNMGMEFMPSIDSTQMSVTMSIDKDKNKSELIQKSDEFVKRVLTIDGVDTVGAVDGSSMGMMGSSNSNSISFYVILDEEKSLSNNEIAKQIEEKTKDLNAKIEISTSNMDISAIAGSGIEIQVKGIKLEKIQDIAKDIAKIVSGVEGTFDISNGMEEASTELKLVVNKDNASKYGLTVATIYNEISKILESENNATTVTFESGEYPVIVYSNTNASKENILNKEIKGTKDNKEVTIKLSDVVSLKEVDTLQAINHTNQSRFLSVTAKVDENHNINLVSREIEKQLKDYKLPSGYSIELKGENETITKTLFDMILMGALAIIFVYLIMVAQFQSLLSPFIVMFTIPLAFTGGLLALIITKTTLNITSMLGFLVLSGVVVNNGIVFVDYINQLRLNGYDKKEAIIQTGRCRIRPILMTALTTILAMSTMALGVGMGAEMSQGLAIVTIGGLMYSTLLTLIVIPIMYDLIHRKEVLPIIDEDF